MSSVQDSVIFGNILSTPESAAIWSDRTRTQYYLDFEASLARVQARLDVIPQKAASEIVKSCEVDKIDFDLLRKQTELIGYPVLGVVKQLVKQVNDVEAGLGEWAHWGATTQVNRRPDHPPVADTQSGCDRHSYCTATAGYAQLDRSIPQ